MLRGRTRGKIGELRFRHRASFVNQLRLSVQPLRFIGSLEPLRFNLIAALAFTIDTSLQRFSITIISGKLISTPLRETLSPEHDPATLQETSEEQPSRPTKSRKCTLLRLIKQRRGNAHLDAASSFTRNENMNSSGVESQAGVPLI